MIAGGVGSWGKQLTAKTPFSSKKSDMRVGVRLQSTSMLLGLSLRDIDERS